ncbi:hypothetical protein LguiA_016303 [Lonicera macranthoides]
MLFQHLLIQWKKQNMCNQLEILWIETCSARDVQEDILRLLKRLEWYANVVMVREENALLQQLQGFILVLIFNAFHGS